MTQADTRKEAEGDGQDAGRMKGMLAEAVSRISDALASLQTLQEVWDLQSPGPTDHDGREAPGGWPKTQAGPDARKPQPQPEARQAEPARTEAQTERTAQPQPAPGETGNGAAIRTMRAVHSREEGMQEIYRIAKAGVIAPDTMKNVISQVLAMHRKSQVPDLKDPDVEGLANRLLLLEDAANNPDLQVTSQTIIETIDALTGKGRGSAVEATLQRFGAASAADLDPGEYPLVMQELNMSRVTD